jgi:cyanophycinase
MKINLKSKRLITFLFVIFFNIGSINIVLAQQSVSKEHISPIHGKLMLLGTGEISDMVGATFAHLAGGENGTLVIITNLANDENKIRPQWKELIGNAYVIKLDDSKPILPDADLAKLRGASGVWLTNDFSKNWAGLQLNDELKSVLLRDGVVGGQGRAAESLATIINDGKNVRDGFNLLPNSFIMASGEDNDQFIKTLNTLPGRVGWEIPPSGAVVIHNGRQISVIGYPEITLRTPANGAWPERFYSFGPPIDDLPYTTDLISWNRSGIARLGEVYPPAVAPVPEVPNGALMIIGGHGFPKGMWKKVIKFAGGKNANYVCISQSDESVGARELKEHKCKHVSVHIISDDMNGKGNGYDSLLLKDLSKADAVYFGGGRTYKYMDAYLNTPAHELMMDVLDRGGIILGGSAGAQIQGDFLVRGDPRTNDSLWMQGNDVGLGFIQGVIIDVHYRQREREKTLPSLLLKHPQMLGIGIDETTAIFVQGTTAEVMGEHSVTFYDLKNTQTWNTDPTELGNPVILKSGEKYDLKKRRPLN